MRAAYLRRGFKGHDPGQIRTRMNRNRKRSEQQLKEARRERKSTAHKSSGPSNATQLENEGGDPNCAESFDRSSCASNTGATAAQPMFRHSTSEFPLSQPVCPKKARANRPLSAADGCERMGMRSARNRRGKSGLCRFSSNFCEDAGVKNNPAVYVATSSTGDYHCQELPASMAAGTPWREQKC
ncbi:hypothetical protein BSKO_07225 [Bryopsis sp. KO-2023]|nr:hypothetical protein BSKO_07225 [Bryopsis sp. KO-2023]